MTDGALIKTGERAYCLVGKWDDYESIVEARPQMVGIPMGSATCWKTWAVGSAGRIRYPARRWSNIRAINTDC